jgi:adenosine deaminase
MDNLRNAIEIIFAKNCPETVFKDLTNRNLFKLVPISVQEFISIGSHTQKNKSIDELENLYQKLKDDWYLDVYQEKKSKQSIYNLLIHFNKQVLDENNKAPVIKNENFLRWRELSYLLGEDIFTCSYLAYMDNRSSRNRSYYSWSPVTFSDNKRLKQLLRNGLAENHFHLKGSGPVFELAWLATMNQPSKMMAKFNEFLNEYKLSAEIVSTFSNSKKDISTLVYKAAFIRLELFKLISLNITNKERSNALDNFLQQPSNKEDSFEIYLNLNNLQAEIDTITYNDAYYFSHKGSHSYADYCIPKNISDYNFEGSVLLYGERKFLYSIFRKIYSDTKNNERLQKLFYAYLLIKNQFRAELIQVNKKVGFGNFRAYQDRKEHFLPHGSIYETAFLSMAVNDSRKFQKIDSFELRIAPKTSALNLHKGFKNIEKSLNKNSIAEFGFRHDFILSGNSLLNTEFYTIHFIKKKDKKIKNLLVSMVTSRHAQLRQEVKDQARAIVNLRESYSTKSKLIRGIDAASSEFDARPEVFAQAFRYLKDHKLKGAYVNLKSNSENKEHKLKSTFHAGEDFYDIVDGLRTIDEVVKFLNFRSGDRLGHALALGIKPNDYFEFKGMKLMMPKGMLLDNIAWLLSQVRKANIEVDTGEIARLTKKFESLFYEIYQQHGSTFYNTHVSIDQFYNAWKLRGDDPDLYKTIKDNIDIESIPNMTYWERCRINYYYPFKSNLRKHSLILNLYHAYHFDPKVKLNSDKICQFEITDRYIKLVCQIQKYMQKQIMSLNIGIECNPTSNYLIGTFKRYDKHPIIDFYNLGLETNQEKIEECPQLFVSINTDDQGIFGTSLENEFALMAIALEKAKDENGMKKYKPSMIYDWLDRIRKMGLEQSFNNLQS